MTAPTELPLTFQIPTVTEHDLLAFHAQHLSPQAVAHFPFGPAPVNQQPELEDDVGLGYYDDGVKRTLTDEQIAMFRHSEIQALLRERRHARENREAEMSEEGEIGEDNLEGAAVDCTEGGHHETRHDSEHSPRNGEVLLAEKLQKPSSGNVAGSDDGMETSRGRRSRDTVDGPRDPSQEVFDNEDEAYEDFLQKERSQMTRQAKKRKWNSDKPIEGYESEKGERRIAREQDESNDVGGELDYGDDSGPPKSSMTESRPKQQQSQHPLGRRIVAYGDEGDGGTDSSPSSAKAKHGEKRAFLWPKIGS